MNSSPNIIVLLGIQFILLMILMLHSHENGKIIKELQEIKIEVSK